MEQYSINYFTRTHTFLKNNFPKTPSTYKSDYQLFDTLLSNLCSLLSRNYYMNIAYYQTVGTIEFREIIIYAILSVSVCEYALHEAVMCC